MTRAVGQLFDVVILGAGPAGAVAALGLAAKGLPTAVISRPGAGVTSRAGTGVTSRAASSGVQGLSARALVSLTEVGLGAAAACASEPATRSVLWAGEQSERGQEFLIERGAFDARLRASLQDGVVCWMDASVQDVAFIDGAWQIATNCGSVRGRTVLDARGRFARRSNERGPLLVSRSFVLESGRPSAPRSAVAALDDGWCWLAVTNSGTYAAQFVGSATRRLSREQVADRVQSAARSLADLGLCLEDLGLGPADLGLRPAADVGQQIEPLIGEGTYGACAAVARYSQPSRGPGYLRIGDAAVAMDPLSGNGIHEAVRSARVAVAAVNSYLRGEPWSVVARFVDERSRELWRRSVTAAAGFYRLQADWSGSAFWKSVAETYERAADGATIRVEGKGQFEMRPVLNGEQIELRRVWVSPDWPRGVWKVNGRSVTPHEV